MSTFRRLVVAALLVGGLTACGGETATSEIKPVEQQVQAPKAPAAPGAPPIRDRQSLEGCEIASACGR